MARVPSEGFPWAEPGLQGVFWAERGFQMNGNGLALTQVSGLGKACGEQGRYPG